MEIPTLGENCAFRGCGQLDFLPFVCRGCAQTFCLDHRNDHGCGYVGSSDTTCVVCPICGSSVKHVPGESIHVTFERHSATSCDPNKHPSRMKRCGAPRCKEKLTTVNTYRCKDCGTEVCLTHRFPDKHACDDRKRESKRASSSSFFGAGASTSNAARASQTKAQLRDKAARVSHSSVASGMRKRGEAAAREVCDVCGKSFPHIAALIAHAEQAHQVHGAATRARVTGGQSLGGGEFGTSSGREVCPQCGKSFVDLTALLNHVERAHEGRRRSSSSASQCVVS